MSALPPDALRNLSTTLPDYLPVYFQAVQGASPIRSGIDFLGMVMFITPSCMVVGASVQIANRYRPQNYIGWILTVIGFGILTLLDTDSSKAKYIGCQVVLGIGLGIIWIGTQVSFQCCLLDIPD